MLTCTPHHVRSCLTIFITPSSICILWGLHPPTGLSFPFAQNFNTRFPQSRICAPPVLHEAQATGSLTIAVGNVRHDRPSKSVTVLSISPYLTTLSHTLQTYDGRNPDSAYTNAFLRQTSFATSHTATYSQSRNSISGLQLQRRQERKGSLSAVSERYQSYEQCSMLCPTECVTILTTNHVLSR